METDEDGNATLRSKWISVDDGEDDEDINRIDVPHGPQNYPEEGDQWQDYDHIPDNTGVVGQLVEKVNHFLDAMVLIEDGDSANTKKMKRKSRFIGFPTHWDIVSYHIEIIILEWREPGSSGAF